MRQITLFFIGIFIAFLLTQCSKMPDQPLIDQQTLSELSDLDMDIEELIVWAELSDSNEVKEKNFINALEKLDLMLDKINKVVSKYENEEVESLLDSAKQFRDEALTAYENGDLEAAFEALKNARKNAREAYELVVGKKFLSPHQKKIFKRLKEKRNSIKELKIRINEELKKLNNYPNKKTKKLHRLLKYHFRVANKALSIHHLRKAKIHLEEANKYAKRLAKILFPEEESGGE